MANKLYTPINIFGYGQKSFANSMKNLQNVGKARREAQKERENLDFERKERKLKLEKMRREGAMSELEIKTLEAQQKEYEKQQKSILDGKEAEIGVVEQQVRDEADRAKQLSQQAFRADPQGVTQYVMQNRGKRTLRPKWVGGKLTYETVDVQKEALEREKLMLDVEQKRKKIKGEPTRKDVVDLAKDIAGKYASPEEVRSMIPEAKSLLKGDSVEYDDKTESLIKQNMEHYGRSREEVVSAMKSKGIIK